jgi:DNA sulfur modification protein DndB
MIGTYTFTAFIAYHGKHAAYLFLCPVRLVPRLLLGDERDVPVPLLTAPDPTRVATLTEYLQQHTHDYIIPPLIAVADRKVSFTPTHPDQPFIGQLAIPVTARLILLSGHDWRAAIQHHIQTGELADSDMVPIVLYPDPDLVHAPHWHAILNPAPSPRTRSQRVQQDQRDLAQLVRQLVERVPLFQGLTEMEKTTLSNRSVALFTLSGVYQATQALLGVSHATPITATHAEQAQDFWEGLGAAIPEWQQVIRREVSAASLRTQYVHAHSVTLLAIGMVGHTLLTTYPDTWQTYLPRFGSIDWSRTNTSLWEGRAMVRGKMSKAHDSIRLTADVIRQEIGLDDPCTR